MKVESLLEQLLIVAIGVVLALTYILHIPESIETWKEVTIDENAFDEFPLLTWEDTNKKGNVLKIKYRVSKEKTFIEVVNDEGKVVHRQPYERSPWPDGKPRDFTYTWTLYYTQDYGDDIPPGDYEIRVCNVDSRNIYLRTWIII